MSASEARRRWQGPAARIAAAVAGGRAMAYAAAAGAALGSWLLLPVPVPAVAALLLVCLWRPSPVLVLAVFAALAGMLGARALAGLAEPPSGPLDAWVTLLDDPRPLGSGGTRATVRHDRMRLEARAYGRASADLDDLLAGERVRLTGTVRPASGDWQRWRHVTGTVNVDRVRDSAPAAPLAAFANSVRRLLATGAESLSRGDRSLFTGMVYGDDRHQSARLSDDFRAAGLGHLLVVSGQNVAFVLALAAPLASRLRPGVRLLALLGVLAVFAVLTRFEPSVLRAVTMAVVAVGSAALGRPQAGRRTLAWAVAAVLVVDPFLVRVLAFQLSVCATAGLLWITPSLAEALPGWRPLRLALATTAGAQLAVTPLLVAVFGGVPLASLPANVIAGPASAPVMMWGLTGGMAAGAMGGWPAWVAHRPTALLLWWVRGVASAAAAAPPAMLGARGAAVAGAGVAALLVARRLRARGARGQLDHSNDNAGLLARHHPRTSGARGELDHSNDNAGPPASGCASAAAAPTGHPRSRASSPSIVGSGLGHTHREGRMDRGSCAAALSIAGACALAAVFAHSVLGAAAPHAGWSQVSGARVFSGGGAVVVVLEGPGPPKRLLQSLRTAGVRRVDLVVASAGGAADAHAVLAVTDRHPDAAVVAPPMHRVPGARTVRTGWTVGLGTLAVEVASDDPALVVTIRSRPVAADRREHEPRETILRP